jgi:hypothetical protein
MTIAFAFHIVRLRAVCRRDAAQSNGGRNKIDIDL